MPIRTEEEKLAVVQDQSCSFFHISPMTLTEEDFHPFPKNKGWLESISPTCYARLFQMKVLRKTFLFLDFRFVLFWRKNIGAKASRILLVKLTPGCKFEENRKTEAGK